MELSGEQFKKYTTGGLLGKNPYGYHSTGFRPHYDTLEVIRSVNNNGIFDFKNASYYGAQWDLRNPKNKEIKDEIFNVFGLDPNKNYYENSKLTNTILPTKLIEQIV